MSGLDEFKQGIIIRYKEVGRKWLDQLPHLVNQCAQKWSLTDLEPVDDLTYNYVLSGFQGANHIILKLRCSVYDRVLIQREVDALQATQQYRAVTLLAYDQDLGALLLQKIIPGTTLAGMILSDDKQATQCAVKLLQQLHTVPLVSDAKFSCLNDVIPHFEYNFAILAPFTSKARHLRELLLKNEPYTHVVLLHGDFHHGNILLGASHTYYAIDPEGMIGDPGYDMAVFIRNPLTTLITMPHIKEIIINRIKIFSDYFGYDAKRVCQWVYLQAFTSAYWSLEDGEKVDRHGAFLTCMETILEEYTQ